MRMLRQYAAIFCCFSVLMNSVAALLFFVPPTQRSQYSFDKSISTTTKLHISLQQTQQQLGPRLDINQDFPGLKRVHANPDVYVIENFLDESSCEDIIVKASQKDMNQSPVAYAGWTSDFKDLMGLAAKGPVSWLAIVSAWVQTKDDPTASVVGLVVHAVQNFAILLVLATIGIAAFTKFRADGLQQLRTSTSTTLDELQNDNSPGTLEFVRQTARLFSTTIDNDLQRAARYFEAPTVIRYEKDQVLAPHYDANRSATLEDANRGGQTLATLLVYLNDVNAGGATRFGKLMDNNGNTLEIQPKRGDALLFFPADKYGEFDERTEHEGCAAIDEKWIARIWRHTSRVPPPFGLDEANLSRV